MDDSQFSFPLPVLLYCGRGNSIDSSAHSHPFYQLEICTAGELRCKGRGGSFSLPADHMWLIPPETSHCFLSRDESTEYCSFKFTYGMAFPESRYHDDVVAYHVQALSRLVRDSQLASQFTASGKEIMEHHIFALLWHLASRVSVSDLPRTNFMVRLKEEVSIHGYRINVQQLASLFHLSRAQLKYQFQRESGGEESVKHYIDKVLLEIATNHLRYSDYPFMRIAKMMSFPDLPCFSRFIKKHAGVSPREYRRRLREGGAAMPSSVTP